MRPTKRYFIAIVALIAGMLPRQVSAQASMPVLLVHGICSTSHAWDPVLDTLKSERVVNYGNRVVRLYYDGANVQRADVGVLDPGIDPALRRVRLFTIDFFNPAAGPINGFNADRVMDQPLEYKTQELRAVIAKIRALTGSSKVILVGHSMGGLVARAYVQNRGWVSYAGDVASVITVDSPHRGSEWAHVNVSVDGCQSGTSVVKVQLEAENQNPFLQGLNNASLPSAVKFVSIASWTRFPDSANPNVLRDAEDGIVTLWSQTLKTGSYASNANVTSVENVVSAASCSTIGFPLPFSKGACELHTKVFRFRKTVDLINGLLDEMVPCVSGTSATLVSGIQPVRARGSVIKRAGDSTVWVLRARDEHNFGLHRDGVPSVDRLANLYSIGSKWFGDIVTVSAQEFAQYPVGGTLSAIGPLNVTSTLNGTSQGRQPGTLIKYGSEISIVSDDGWRHPFSSGDNFTRMGYNFCQPREVSVGEYYSYSLGPLADSRQMFLQ